MPKLGILILLLAGLLAAGQWPQLRGPQGNGIAETSALPEAFGPETNLVWKTVIPAGYSSPVLTGFDAESGKILKAGRLPSEAIDRYWASPIYGDGKIFLVSEACAVSIVSPGGQWETVRVNLLEDKCIATPAIADGRLFIRTEAALYSFGKQ